MQAVGFSFKLNGRHGMRVLWTVEKEVTSLEQVLEEPITTWCLSPTRFVTFLGGTRVFRTQFWYPISVPYLDTIFRAFL